MFSVVISCLFEPPWIDDQGSDFRLPSINFSLEISKRVQGRQFLIGGQAHLGREVSTTFELWFRGTSNARQVYGG